MEEHLKKVCRNTKQRIWREKERKNVNQAPNMGDHSIKKTRFEMYFTQPVDKYTNLVHLVLEWEGVEVIGHKLKMETDARS